MTATTRETTPAPTSRPLRPLLEGAVLLGLTALALWLRWPALSTEGFHNEDAAGITYNADLLRRGYLPLADNLEYKAPGPFYLAWFAWALFGRSIVTLQWTAALWSIGATYAIYCGGRMLYGLRSACIAALIYTVASPITDSIDINYHAWMAFPYVASTALFIAGLKRGGWGWYAGAGATLAFAALMKHQAGALFPVFLGTLAVAHKVARPEGWAPVERLRGAVAFLGGLAAGFAVPLVWYLAHGEVGAFVTTYFFSSSGWKYVQGEIGLADKLLRLEDGLLGFWEFMALPALLAAITVASVRPTRGWTLRGVLLGGHFWMSFAGAALGFRFFKSYYLQVLPAAVWLAAHPDGAIRRWLSRDAWPRDAWERLGRATLLGCVVAALAVAALADYPDLKQIRGQRKRARDPDAQAVGKLIRESTTSDERIWVWGRWAWPVYFHADRLSSTRFYKVLGVLTTNLTNTWRRPTENTRFTPEGPWREVIADLERTRPVYVVVAPNEDYSQFTAFKDLLKRDYDRVAVPRARNLSVFRLKGHGKPAPAPAPAGAAAPPPGP